MKKPITRRIWVYRIITVVLSPIIFLLLLEGGLRLFGYGDSVKFFLPVAGQDTVTGNPRYTYPYFPKQLVREPDMFLMEKKKAAGTYRIFVLGGSAARGTPDPRFGFGRILEVMLEEAYPDRQFEVINTAMVAINSHVVLRIADECADYDPDLFVIYMGNNEVVGPYGANTIFGQSVPGRGMVNMSITARSTRIGQLAMNIMQGIENKSTKPEWLGMEMFLEHRVVAGDPRLKKVYRHFEANLHDIAETARAADVPLLLCTVPVNLRHCAPLASDHSPDLGDAKLAEWKKLYNEGAALEAEDRWADAEERYANAAALDDMYAELHFRRARCSLALGNHEAARRYFETARDLDTLRFRSVSEINEIIRRAGESNSVSLLDVEERFKTLPQVKYGIPGNELFYEHVHFNFEGNFELARMVFDETAKQLGETPPKAMPSLERCEKLLGLSKLDRFQMATSMMDLVVQPPFTDQLDYYERCEKLHAKIRALREHTKGKGLDDAENALNTALASRSDSLHTRVALARLQLMQKRGDKAESTARALIESLPERSDFHSMLGQALLAQGKTNEAEKTFDTSIAMAARPEHFMVLAADAYEQAGDREKAIRLYQRVLEAQPGSGNRHNQLAEIYLKHGDLEKALELLQRADTLQPENGRILYNLSRVHFENGDLDTATEQLRATLKANPFHLGAHMHLGLILKRHGHLQESATRLAAVVQHEPTRLDIQLHLAEARVGLGKFNEAESVYRNVIKIAPDKLDAALGLAWLLAVRPDATPEKRAEAAQLAERVFEETGGRSAKVLDVLAAACASTGRFGEARSYAGHAWSLARDAQDVDLAKAISARRELYRQSKPYRLPKQDDK